MKQPVGKSRVPRRCAGACPTEFRSRDRLSTEQPNPRIPDGALLTALDGRLGGRRMRLIARRPLRRGGGRGGVAFGRLHAGARALARKDGTPGVRFRGENPGGGRYLPARVGRGLVNCAPVPYRRDAVSDPLSRDPGPEEAVDFLGFSPKTPQRMRVTGERAACVKVRRPMTDGSDRGFMSLPRCPCGACGPARGRQAGLGCVARVPGGRRRDARARVPGVCRSRRRRDRGMPAGRRRDSGIRLWALRRADPQGGGRPLPVMRSKRVRDRCAAGRLGNRSSGAIRGTSPP